MQEVAEIDSVFLTLEQGYQHVLRLAQHRLGIKISPLEQLSGGRSGALLYLVSISSSNDQAAHYILKLESVNQQRDHGQSEAERHQIALTRAPQEFAEDHIAQRAFEPVIFEGRSAIFYKIAGGSLQQCRPVNSYHQQRQLQTIFRTISRGLLDGWNTQYV